MAEPGESEEAKASSGRTGRKRADDVLALELARGAQIDAAAKAAGIHPSTVYKRLKDRAFKDRVTELRGQMLERAAGALADSMLVATLVIKQLLTSKDENVRLKAADKLLTHALRVSEQTELRREMDELKQMLEQNKQEINR